MKKMNLVLALTAGVALCGTLRADEAAASTSPSASASADTSTASTSAAVTTNDAPGSLKAGKALLDKGKFAEAAAYFEGIGEQSADNGKTKREPYRQLDLASAYLGEGQYQQAEDAANKALALDKDLSAAWNDLASAQVNSGDRASAIATYTKAIAQLQADQIDTDRLAANLKVLQVAAGDEDDSASAATPTAAAAAPAASSASGTASK